jgi:hypothetical protein
MSLTSASSQFDGAAHHAFDVKCPSRLCAAIFEAAAQQLQNGCHDQEEQGRKRRGRRFPSRRPCLEEIRSAAYSTTLPPRWVQLMTSVVSVQPWPLQAFWPLQEDEADLQALVPLQELTPLHFTPPALAVAAKLPAAKIAVAVAMRVFLVMGLSPWVDHSVKCRRHFHCASMPLALATVKSVLGDAW